MLSFRSDIPFDREDAHTLLPWIIGFMVCLTGLLLAATLSIGSHIQASSRHYINSFQVQVPPAENGMKHDVSQIMQALLAMQDVQHVEQLRESEMLSLIQPWVGDDFSMEDLPLPVIMEVYMKDSVDSSLIDYQRIEDVLARIVPGTDVQSHEEWVANFMQFTHTINVIAIALSVLLITSLVAIVVLAARTSLKLHFKTVSILHHIGARDDYIMRQFLTHGLMMVFKGGAVGALVSFGLYALLSTLAANMQSPLLPAIDIDTAHVALFVGMPLFTALVAWLAVRWTIGAMLEHMH